MAGKVSANPDEFLLPDLGEGLDGGDLIEWCVKVGQQVNEFDTLAKMETAKALVEIPSPRAGVIAELHHKAGDFVKTYAVFVTYKGDGDAAAAPAPSAKPQAAPKEEEREDAGTVVGKMSAMAGIEAAPGKVIATPAVRRIARDLGVDLNSIQGTGIGGRILEKDVQAVGSGAVAPAPSKQAPAPRRVDRAAPSAPAVGPSDSTGVTRIPFRGVRKTIADRLRQSVNHAVHFVVMDEADVTDLDVFRRRLVGASGEKISFLPLVAFAVCKVLSGQLGTDFNKLNAHVDDEKSEIIQHRAVNLGIATDTENGLMVPVIRNADRMSVLEIGREIARLASAARDRTIAMTALTGSTFTISNVGSLAGKFATPIINYPEVAILAVGRARDGVIVRNGMIGVGKTLPLSMTCDHRVVDGGTAATALARIIELLQKPDQLLPAK